MRSYREEIELNSNTTICNAFCENACMGASNWRRAKQYRIHIDFSDINRIYVTEINNFNRVVYYNENRATKFYFNLIEVEKDWDINYFEDSITIPGMKTRKEYGLDFLIKQLIDEIQ